VKKKTSGVTEGCRKDCPRACKDLTRLSRGVVELIPGEMMFKFHSSSRTDMLDKTALKGATTLRSFFYSSTWAEDHALSFYAISYHAD
jgi:hypothetical protein